MRSFDPEAVEDIAYEEGAELRQAVGIYRVRLAQPSPGSVDQQTAKTMKAWNHGRKRAAGVRAAMQKEN